MEEVFPLWQPASKVGGCQNPPPHPATPPEEQQHCHSHHTSGLEKPERKHSFCSKIHINTLPRRLLKGGHSLFPHNILQQGGRDVPVLRRASRHSRHLVSSPQHPSFSLTTAPILSPHLTKTSPSTWPQPPRATSPSAEQRGMAGGAGWRNYLRVLIS